MDSTTRWMLLRDLDVFPPAPHTLVLCQRDLSWEIMEDRKERRHEFVVDHFSGKTWGRIGAGHYIKWSSIPPAGMMVSPNKIPSPNKLVVVCCSATKFSGVRIGRVNYEGVWQIYGDILGDWIAIPAAYMEGWLALPN